MLACEIGGVTNVTLCVLPLRVTCSKCLIANNAKIQNQEVV